MSVKRFDRGTFKPVRMDNGWLKADASLTRTGIFPYRNLDGTICNELRLPEEVFNEDSLSSLSLVPLTLKHPPKMLTAKNAKTYTVGSVGSDIRADGNSVKSTLMITDADAVEAVEAGKNRETSCGYNCDLDFTPGIHQGQRYDAIQRNIRYNHVALVPMGRAGRDIKVHLDAEDAYQVEDSTNIDSHNDKQTKEQRHMPKIRLDGIEFEASEQLIQAISVMQTKHNDALEVIKNDVSEKTKVLEQTQAKLDAKEDDIKKIQEKLDKALDPKTRQDAIKARLDLERTAQKVLGETEKLDSLTDKQIKEKIILKSHPSAKLDGKSDDYIEARFDAAIEALPKDEERNDSLDAIRKAAGNAQSQTRLDSSEARKKAMDEDDQRWQKPVIQE